MFGASTVSLASMAARYFLNLSRNRRYIALLLVRPTYRWPIPPNDGISYAGADKSLARPIYRFIFFMVRIFRFMLVLLYIKIELIFLQL